MFNKVGKPLKIGTTDISKIKLGTNNINKIYVGTNLVFDTDYVNDTFYIIKDGQFQNGITCPQAIQGNGYIKFDSTTSGSYRWITFTMNPKNASLATSLCVTAATTNASTNSTIELGYFFASDTQLDQISPNNFDFGAFGKWVLGAPKTNSSSTFQTYVYDRALGDINMYFPDTNLYYGICTTLTDLRIKNLYLKANLDYLEIMRVETGEVRFGYVNSVNQTYWYYDPQATHDPNYIQLNATAYSDGKSYTVIGFRGSPINLTNYKTLKISYRYISYASQNATVGIYLSSTEQANTRVSILPSNTAGSAETLVEVDGPGSGDMEVTIDISDIAASGYLNMYLYSPNTDNSVTTLRIYGIELYGDAL